MRGGGGDDIGDKCQGRIESKDRSEPGTDTSLMRHGFEDESVPHEMMAGADDECGERWMEMEDQGRTQAR